MIIVYEFSSWGYFINVGKKHLKHFELFYFLSVLLPYNKY